MENNHLASIHSRIYYIDIFRAIGIILMIMGHVGFGSLFDKWIHIFHMPMFFIISGFFWKEQSFTTMLKKKTKTLLIPYFAFGVFHLIIHFIRIGHIDTQGYYLMLWENTAKGGIPIAGALWFLTAMFFSEVLFWCVHRLKSYRAVIVSVLISVAGMSCATYLPFRLPLALDVGMVGVGLYEIGKLLKEKWNKLLDLNGFISLFGFVLFSVLGFVNGYVNLRQGMYGIWPLFWINAVAATISLWNLSRLLYGWVEEKKQLNKLLMWLRGVGRDSIIYVCLNQLMILITIHLVWFFQADSRAELLVKKTAILTITMIGLYIAQTVIMKTSLKYVVGKQR